MKNEINTEYILMELRMSRRQYIKFRHKNRHFKTAIPHFDTKTEHSWDRGYTAGYLDALQKAIHLINCERR